MFVINEDKSIYLTRGDIAVISVSADDDDTSYMFKVGDIVRLRICERNHYERVVVQIDVEVKEETPTVDIPLTKDDTKIGDIINKPVDYWYEIEVNPDTRPQTIIGHDNAGAKIFKLFPEGADA